MSGLFGKIKILSFGLGTIYLKILTDWKDVQGAGSAIPRFTWPRIIPRALSPRKIRDLLIWSNIADRIQQLSII
jgi:hypothetical protein